MNYNVNIKWYQLNDFKNEKNNENLKLEKKENIEARRVKGWENETSVMTWVN